MILSTMAAGLTWMGNAESCGDGQSELTNVFLIHTESHTPLNLGSYDVLRCAYLVYGIPKAYLPNNPTVHGFGF